MTKLTFVIILALGCMVNNAFATVMQTFTTYGTVDRGVDNAGVFTVPGSDLTGKRYMLSITSSVERRDMLAYDWHADDGIGIGLIGKGYGSISVSLNDKAVTYNFPDIHLSHVINSYMTVSELFASSDTFTETGEQVGLVANNRLYSTGVALFPNLDFGINLWNQLVRGGDVHSDSWVLLANVSGRKTVEFWGTNDVVSIPEPSSPTLIGCGAMLIGLLRRNRLVKR